MRTERFVLVNSYADALRESDYSKAYDVAFVLIGKIQEHLESVDQRRLSKGQRDNVWSAIVAAIGNEKQA